MAERLELHVGDRVRIIFGGDETKWNFLYQDSVGIISEIDYPAYKVSFENRIYNNNQTRYPESEYGKLIPKFAYEDLELLDNVMDDFNALLIG